MTIFDHCICLGLAATRLGSRLGLGLKGLVPSETDRRTFTETGLQIAA